MTASAALEFVLYSRPGCGLCEEMLDALRALPQAAHWRIDVQDVDDDPDTRRRFGHKVPVLLLNDELVCQGALDHEELRKSLAVHR